MKSVKEEKEEKLIGILEHWKTNNLSAIEATNVPNKRLEPNPAIKSSSMLCLSIPYESYKAYMCGPCSQSPAANKIRATYIIYHNVIIIIIIITRSININFKKIGVKIKRIHLVIKDSPAPAWFHF